MEYEVQFSQVNNPTRIQCVVKLADTIWREHYTPIIGKAQVDYMLDNFQSSEAIEQQISLGMEYVLIDYKNLPVGYLAFEKREKELFLSKIYLLREFRGKGLGKKAMTYVYKKAQEQKCSQISLTVNKNNKRSITAYEGMGFEKGTALILDIGGGFVMDDYKMVKEL